MALRSVTQSQAFQENGGSIFLEPTPDPFSIDMNPFKVVGETPFEAVQKTLDPSASRREDGQTDQDEEYPLKERKEEAKNSQPDKEPAND